MRRKGINILIFLDESYPSSTGFDMFGIKLDVRKLFIFTRWHAK